MPASTCLYASARLNTPLRGTVSGEVSSLLLKQRIWVTFTVGPVSAGGCATLVKGAVFMVLFCWQYDSASTQDIGIGIWSQMGCIID